MGNDKAAFPSTIGRFEIFRYIGPGFLVTVGFIDPGNWVSNLSAGADYGYGLLWIVVLSTLMLIVLQHNAAHLGIVTGLCLSEASVKYFGKTFAFLLIMSALLASAATAFAEILGAAIGLNMLTGLPTGLGAVLTTLTAIYMIYFNKYGKIENWIIGFVSLIGISFLFDLGLIDIRWPDAVSGALVPSFPSGSMPVIMSVLGAVVMPHNLFLHSEIIQSRQWNLQGEDVVNSMLKYEFIDTLSAMTAGWAINSAMMIIAASVFYSGGMPFTDLRQAHASMTPLLGKAASTVFAFALVLSGFSSSITAAMAGGSISAGLFGRPFDSGDGRSRAGILITLLGALPFILLIRDQFKALLWSQAILAMQLPFSIASLIILTTSSKVMGKFSSPFSHKLMLWITAAVVSILNIAFFFSIFA